MSTMQENVKLFHHLGQQKDPQKIDFSTWPGALRVDLMQEELNEITSAWNRLRFATNKFDREDAEADIIDGLVDLMYVTLGSAVAAGVDLDPFWDEVQRANMSKVDGSLGPLKFREDGKLLKPDGWKPPDILGLLRRIKESQE